MFIEPINLISDIGIGFYLYLAAVLVFAGTVHGAIGLGFPMVATPLIAIVFDVRFAILITLMPTVVVNIATIWGGHDYRSSLKDYRLLFYSSFVGALIGSMMLAYLDPSPFRLALAILIIFYLWTTYSGKSFNSVIPKNERLAMIGFGFMAGVSGGITNVMVAILIVYFLSLNMTKSKMVPILNTCFLIGKVTQISILAATQIVSLNELIQTLPLAAISFVALLVGKKVGENIGAELYKKGLYGLLFILATILILQFFNETVF